MLFLSLSMVKIPYANSLYKTGTNKGLFVTIYGEDSICKLIIKKIGNPYMQYKGLYF